MRENLSSLTPILILASFGVLSGCSSKPGTDAPASETWDSAGIQIVRSVLPLDEGESGWSVSESPTLEMVSDPINPDGVLHWTRDATRLSDGRIAVVSGSDKNLRFFDAQGELLTVVGRDGDGPGEFRGPYQVNRLPGDTVLVRDRAQGRISWFSPEGSFLRSVSPNQDALREVAPPEFPRLGQLLAIPSGQAVWVAAGRGEIEYGRMLRTAGVVLLTTFDGSDPTHLGPYAGREQYFLRQGVGRFSFFGPDTYVAAGGDPLRIYLGDSRTFEAHVFDSTGERIRIIQDDVPPAEIEDRDLEWERKELFDFIGQFGMTEAYTEFADKMPIPSQKPAFEALIVDSEGYLWAKEYSSYRPDPIRYRVFSPDGVRVGTVKLPGRLRVFEIGRDYLLGVHYDPDYVETLQMFGLVRPDME